MNDLEAAFLSMEALGRSAGPVQKALPNAHSWNQSGKN